jgi:hypothetical protein
MVWCGHYDYVHTIPVEDSAEVIRTSRDRYHYLFYGAKVVWIPGGETTKLGARVRYVQYSYVSYLQVLDLVEESLLEGLYCSLQLQYSTRLWVETLMSMFVSWPECTYRWYVVQYWRFFSGLSLRSSSRAFRCMLWILIVIFFLVRCWKLSWYPSLKYDYLYCTTVGSRGLGVWHTSPYNAS